MASISTFTRLKGSACTETDEDWLRHRLLELYHRSMDHIIQDIDELCSRDIYLRFEVAAAVLLYYCVMSTNALCALVLIMSWIELMYLISTAAPNP